MKVAMLGPLEVRDGAGSVRAVTGTRLRALLILLALRAGQVVSAGSLIDELWGSSLPADAANALQALVSRLRRALGDHSAVVSGPAGYRLAIGREDVDVFRFERLAARGHALVERVPDEAAAMLAEALGLWRGEPLSDAAETETGRAAVARLSELRLAAIEDRIDAELRFCTAGRGDAGPDGGSQSVPVPQLVAELEGLLSADPTRETLAALLMRALTADGRRAAALHVFERTRERLADELGADPSPRLAAVHLELLRAEVQADAGPDVTVARAGAEPTAGHPGGARGGNLPVALTSFIGREGDLAEVGALLREHRLVTLTGSGGAGKTRLAVEAARAALAGGHRGGDSSPGRSFPSSPSPGSAFPGSAFPGGAWLAELAPVTDPADVPATVLSALGLREQALLVTRQMRAVDDDALDRLIAALSFRQALLVLDNCEHLIDAAAVLSDRVLARCPGVRILATSREPLNITGEALWPVGPLPEPRAERLFAERAATVSPGFELTPENSAAVSAICRDLDGMPLAIELAAARARAMTPQQIAERLSQRFRLLTGGSRTALPRHQTLRAVVDWSWDLLGDAERALLRRLSVFTGGATLEAAEQVCALPENNDVLDLLTALADKSLVVVRQTPDAPRYGLLETIREYARDRLADAGETEALRGGHAAYFLEFGERAAPHLFGAEQLNWLRLMAGDADNVHLAIRGAVAAGDLEVAAGLVGAFGWFWWLRSMKQEGGDLASLVLRAAPSATQFIESGAGEDPVALSRLTAAYGLGGMLAMDSVHFADSMPWLRAAEELDRRLGPRPDRGFIAHAVGALAAPLRAMVESQTRLAPGVIDAAVDDPAPWVSGLGRVLRGQIFLNKGGLADRAEADFHAAVATFERLGERWGLAMAVSGLAQIEEWQDSRAAAAGHYEQAAELARELGTTEDETQFRLHLARVLWPAGGADRDRARAEVARALRDAERLGWPEVTAFANCVAGNLARRDGDLGAARKLLETAARVAETKHGGPVQVVAVTLTGLGYLAAAEGNLDEARALHDRAVAAALPSGDSPVIAEALTGVADVALRRGDAKRSAMLLGAAEGVRGARNRSDDDCARVSAAASALLSPADYDAAFQRGRAVTLATLEAALAGFLTSGA